MPPALAIMAKHPIPGQVKTRLCPPLTPEQAAALSRCFLLDKIDQVQRISKGSAYLAFSPADSLDFFNSVAGKFLSCIPQEGRDLGERMHNLSRRLVASGHPGVVIIGSDTPTLPDAYLTQAVDCLVGGRTEAVFGPSEDGGYYLVGLRHPHPELFRGIHWSTQLVLEETLGRARALSLKVELLPPCLDVDSPEDLRRLAAELDQNDWLAPHTHALVRELGLGRTAPSSANGGGQRTWDTSECSEGHRPKKGTLS